MSNASYVVFELVTYNMWCVCKMWYLHNIAIHSLSLVYIYIKYVYIKYVCIYIYVM